MKITQNTIFFIHKIRLRSKIKNKKILRISGVGCQFLKSGGVGCFACNCLIISLFYEQNGHLFAKYSLFFAHFQPFCAVLQKYKTKHGTIVFLIFAFLYSQNRYKVKNFLSAPSFSIIEACCSYLVGV